MISKVSFDWFHQGTYESCRGEFLPWNDELQKRDAQGRRCEVLGARSEVEAL